MRWRGLLGVFAFVALALFAWGQQASEPPKDEPPQFVTVFSVEVEQGQEQAFIERFQKRARLIDKAKGYKGMFVLQHTQNANKFLVVTLWRDESSFRAWVNSDEFRKAHAEGGVPTKAMQLDTYRIVAR
jgi:heme-degrading monooxygenase HmoA